MHHKRLSLASHWEELEAGFQKMHLKAIPFKDPMVITKEKTRIKGGKQDFFQPEADRVRPPNQEAAGIGEIITQEPEIVRNTSNRVRSPANINITPTQNENSAVTPEINIESNKMWLKMSQFAEKTHKKRERLQENNVRLPDLTTLQQTTIQNLQEGYSKLSKASEETKKSQTKS
ncbi:hypothetical protein O181_059883 [Austropuccinia psidii MF-1]|uniref:Uncharacterized protein n=1 Tax=Austropuccinia psidii MF-1 TaxID=1389203 RepID=A0A9Q3EJN7_9BASI|nr:hypothetical protein [Austropuccinia psidii MF-1]